MGDSVNFHELEEIVSASLREALTQAPPIITVSTTSGVPNPVALSDPKVIQALLMLYKKYLLPASKNEPMARERERFEMATRAGASYTESFLLELPPEISAVPKSVSLKRTPGRPACVFRSILNK